MSIRWRKSSYSAANGDCLEWRVSSRSGGTNCVQVRGGVEVRDSRDPDGPVLSFGAGEWKRFTTALKAGGVAH